ncbi:hypothetical protein [Allomuricauda sp. d1]|uniref:hypothetical protein n=1 Tax=Allomuricauda sp. d1 TaxID=3136725 RepID=UPI0031DEE3E9
MGSYDKILDKLNQFISKYYRKLLVKGLLLFFAFGLLFFMAALALEYFLWMGSTARLLLLVLVIAFEGWLLYRFILTPLFYLFRIKRGLTNKQASLLIGKHFSTVDDKLYNLLDLAEDDAKSELLLASIEQRSQQLDDVPFVQAVDFKENLKYAKYAVVPFVVIALIALSGNLQTFFGSAERVVNYDLAYEPPAPFTFQLLTEDLTVLDNQALTLRVNTQGRVRPETISVVINGEPLLMQATANAFEYTFEPPVDNAEFYFTANGYDSRIYSMGSLATPSLEDFIMTLDYPNYTERNTENFKGTGNAVVPEGTRITWSIKGDHIGQIDFQGKDTVLSFKKMEDNFELKQRLFRTMEYAITTSNQNIKDHEQLSYSIAVVRDAHPSIKANQVLDSLNPNLSYYTGQVADDYRVSQVRLVWYTKANPKNEQRLILERPNSNVAQFYYTFPSGLELEEGQDYEIYFEVVDNDAIRGGKVTKSQVFASRIMDDSELKDRELDFQQSVLDKFGKSVEKQKEQGEQLEKINQLQKQQNSLDFQDKAQIKDFIQKQQQQENLMQKFTQELKESLKGELDDEQKKLLQERLERQELEAKKNAKLLEELNKIADKIDKEELKKKLEELGKSQSSSERNLEQLLELTKRYYVTEKASQLAKKLEELANDQEVLSEIKLGQNYSDKEQKKLNEKYEGIDSELEELKNDNAGLKKPLELDIDKQKQEGVKQDQKDALEEINKQQGEEQSSESDGQEQSVNKAQQKQKSAAQKMREMSNSLQQSSMGGGGSTITEDAEMLRQILDNLVTFSFKQEALFDKLQSSDIDISQFSNTVRKQKELRGLFEHVDDSLFALSLRQVEIGEFVNEQITEVYYNIDKSLESIAENQIYQGASYQQYVLNASNSLADFLAKLLDNMQQSMQPGQGQGQGNSDFQLPDIIQGQGELQQKMNQMGQKGEKGQQGKEGQQGEKGQDGKQGQEGQEGQEGQDGKSEGENGKGGEEGKDGESGKGKDGQQDGEGGSSSGGMSEAELQEIYEIYKQQQQIRAQLEKQLEDMIQNSDRELAKKLVRQMENFENDLIENGITKRTQNKMNAIQHQLLKLENAAMEQGQKQERESETNKKNYNAPITTKPELLKNQASEIEILNRQALPLRQNYQEKVKQYFKDGN